MPTTAAATFTIAIDPQAMRTVLPILLVGVFLIFLGRRRVSLPMRAAGFAVAAALLLLVLWHALVPLITALRPQS